MSSPALVYSMTVLRYFSCYYFCYFCYEISIINEKLEQCSLGPPPSCTHLLEATGICLAPRPCLKVRCLIRLVVYVVSTADLDRFNSVEMAQTFFIPNEFASPDIFHDCIGHYFFCCYHFCYFSCYSYCYCCC